MPSQPTVGDEGIKKHKTQMAVDLKVNHGNDTILEVASLWQDINVYREHRCSQDFVWGCNFLPPKS